MNTMDYPNDQVYFQVVMQKKQGKYEVLYVNINGVYMKSKSFYFLLNEQKLELMFLTCP